MGNVRFDTNIDKTVDIQKNVRIDVDKSVMTNVDLGGSLASAEASADATGGGGGGGGGAGSIVLTFDGFGDQQRVDANRASGFDPVSDTIGITDTDYANLQRTLFVDVLNTVPPDQGAAALGISDPVPDKLGFSAETGTYTNAMDTYASTDGLVRSSSRRSNAEILANPADYILTIRECSF